jgi:hypothetical protein
MQPKLSPGDKRNIFTLLLMSFFSGIFISYYVSYITALFVKVAGVDNLPLAYMASGIGGMLLTGTFNKFELKYGLRSTSLVLLPIIALSVLIVWLCCTYYSHVKSVFFISYAWFWIIGNFILLLFWKLPAYFLSLGQNKKFNAILSSGEVISAITAYLSIPLLLSTGILKKEAFLLLISFSGICLFFITFFFLPFNNTKLTQGRSGLDSTTDEQLPGFRILYAIPFLRILFSSVVIAVIIQSTVDFSLMIVSREVIQDTKELASFFGFIFGLAKVFELILKTTIAHKLLKHYGVQAGIITFALVICIISLLGLLSHTSGAITFLFIATLLNKIMERSLVRSVYTPTLSILFQVYTGKMQTLAQNFGDGQGKTYGQFIGGILLFLISLIPSYFVKISVINLLLISCSLYLLNLGIKLLPLYREELKKRISGMVFSREADASKLELKEKPEDRTAPKTPKDSFYYQKLKENIKEYGEFLSILQTLERPNLQKLEKKIREESKQLLDKIFQTLEHAHDKLILNNVSHLLASNEPDNQVIALEILELTLENQEKVLVLPVFQESSPAVIIRKLEPYLPIPIRNLDETLTHLAFHHPQKFNATIRYLALLALCESKKIPFNQLAGACFSIERNFRDLALFHLGILFPQHLEDITNRSKGKYPSKSAIDEEILRVEASLN